MWRYVQCLWVHKSMGWTFASGIQEPMDKCLLSLLPGRLNGDIYTKDRVTRCLLNASSSITHLQTSSLSFPVSFPQSFNLFPGIAFSDKGKAHKLLPQLLLLGEPWPIQPPTLPKCKLTIPFPCSKPFSASIAYKVQTSQLKAGGQLRGHLVNLFSCFLQPSFQQSKSWILESIILGVKSSSFWKLA